MFESFSETGQAVNQVGLIFGGSVMLLLGGLLVFNALYWRIKAVRVAATIVDIVQKGRFYYPIYEYIAPDGQTYRARSDVGTTSLTGGEKGEMTEVLILPTDPGTTRSTGSIAALVIGLLLMAGGGAFCVHAFTAYDFTISTATAMACMALIVIVKGRQLAQRRRRQLTEERVTGENGEQE